MRLVRACTVAALVVAASAGTATPASAFSDGFRSPSGDIVCVYQGPGGSERVVLICQTLNDGFTVTLRPSGPARVKTNQRRLPARSFRVLRYNRDWERRPYLCKVTRAVLGCLARSGHMFFLNRDEFWRRRA